MTARQIWQVRDTRSRKCLLNNMMHNCITILSLLGTSLQSEGRRTRGSTVTSPLPHCRVGLNLWRVGSETFVGDNCGLAIPSSSWAEHEEIESDGTTSILQTIPSCEIWVHNGISTEYSHWPWTKLDFCYGRHEREKHCIYDQWVCELVFPHRCPHLGDLHSIVMPSWVPNEQQLTVQQSHN